MANEREDLLGDDEVTAEETTMQDLSLPLFGTAEDVVTRYTHCALCGANLHFSHITDFGQNLTQETAKCPECGVKVRREVHKLQ